MPDGISKVATAGSSSDSISKSDTRYLPYLPHLSVPYGHFHLFLLLLSHQNGVEVDCCGPVLHDHLLPPVYQRF